MLLLPRLKATELQQVRNMDFFYKQDLLATHIFLIFRAGLGNIHSFKSLLIKTGKEKYTPK